MASYDELKKALSNIPDVGFGADIHSRHNRWGWMTEKQYAERERFLPDSDPYSSKPLYARDDADLEGEELSDISGLPFMFNPPVHNWNRPVWLNQGRGEEYQQTMDHWARETSGMSSLGGLKDLRLGRISMGDKAQSFANVVGGTRWGFRFLYNPTTLVGSQALASEVIPSPQEKAMWYLLNQLEVMQIEVVLNRIPDVIVPNVSHRDYTPFATTDDVTQIKKRGTNWDLEFLFRCSNGTALTTADLQYTADFGLISPNPLYLTLGKMQFYGRIRQIQTEHMLWSANMVPILSRVSIAFMRVVAMSQEDFEAYGTNGGRDIGVKKGYEREQEKARERINAAAANPSDGSGATGGQGSESPTAETGTYTQATAAALARSVGFSAPVAEIMGAIAMGESSGIPTKHNPVPPDNSYGLWQINMLGGMGPERRKLFGISSNEDLFNPRVNAQAAFTIYKMQGLRAWTVYTNGSYRKYMP